MIPVSGCLDSIDNIQQYIKSQGSGTSKEGYRLDNTSLTVPETLDIHPKIYDEKPPATSSLDPGFNLSTKYSYRHFYENSTGILKISIRNNDDNPVFIYKYGITYTETDKWKPKDTGITIQPGEDKYVGLLKVDTDKKSEIILKIGLSLLSQTESGKWYDYKTRFFDEFTVYVKPSPEKKNVKYLSNTQPDFDKINNKLNPTNKEVREIATEIAKYYPGKYNIYQVCALFDYTRDNIQYLSDPRGNDYWE